MSNYEEEMTIDVGLILKRLCNFKTIRNIVCAGIVCGVGTFCFSKFCIPEQFTSQVYMYVNNNSVVNTDGKVEINDINASQKIVESCIVILKDSIVMEEIGDRLLQEKSPEEIGEAFTIVNDGSGNITIPAGEISAAISLANVNETEVLEVKVTTKDAEISTAVCGYIADIAPETVKRIIDGGRIEAIGEPSIPLSKSSPNNTKNTVLGSLGGIFVMLFYYVLKIYFDNKIKNSEEFIQRYDIPVLAEIPLYENNKGKKRGRRTEKEETQLKDTSFAVIEAYNSLCSNLLFSARAAESKVIIISSSDANDGKTTTACHIAESLNNITGKVLIVDCDMRKPNVHKRFGKSNKEGLSTVLRGTKSLDDVIVKSEKGLSIVTAGSTPPNVAEILSSRYMDDFINECEERFDYIILDTAPVNIVNDTAILSRFNPCIVYVAKAGKTKYKDMERTEEMLKLVGSRINGIVINGVTAENAYYNRYKYYDYGYGGELKKI